MITYKKSARKCWCVLYYYKTQTDFLPHFLKKVSLSFVTNTVWNNTFSQTHMKSAIHVIINTYQKTMQILFWQPDSSLWPGSQLWSLIIYYNVYWLYRWSKYQVGLIARIAILHRTWPILAKTWEFQKGWFTFSIAELWVYTVCSLNVPGRGAGYESMINLSHAAGTRGYWRLSQILKWALCIPSHTQMLLNLRMVLPPSRAPPPQFRG